MIFLCSPGLFVSSFSASRLQWALFSGHLFFGAKNSENCLHQFLGKREVRAVGAIRDLISGFRVLTAKAQSQNLKIMSHFSFLGFAFC